MKVNVSMSTRSNLYYQARHLQRRGVLNRLYTFYPRPMIAADVRSRCRTSPYAFVTLEGISRIGLSRLRHRLAVPFCNLFDKWVARAMEPADIFVAMSGLGLYARRAAKAMGAFTVCERGSAHVRYQDEILTEEYARFGARIEAVKPAVALKEEAEYREADLIVTQSSFAWRTFRERGFPESKLAWVSPGVDLTIFSPGSAAKPGDVCRVLYLGQISYRKGVQYLLEAVSSMNRSKLELVLAGGILPEAVPLLKRYEGVFRYAGRPATKAEVRDLYRQATVFVLPSVEDGFGLVLKEAMACGTPIIASTNSGGPDLIEEGREGFVVPIRSPEALRERIAYFQDHPAMAREMGQSASEAARRTDYAFYGDQVIDLYRRVLEGSGVRA